MSLPQTIIYRGTSERIAFTPTANIEAGSIVKVGNIVGVTTTAVTSGTRGEIQTVGEYDLTGTSLTVSAGTFVKATATKPDGTSENDVIVGVALESVSSADQVRILLCPFAHLYAVSSSPSPVDNIPKTPLTGVTIDKTAPKVGDTLTATVAPSGATVTYQWYRGTTAIVGATSSTYTALSDDLASALKVVVTATGSYSGTATSDATTAVAAASED